MTFLFCVWLIDLFTSIFFFEWAFDFLRLPEKYINLYEIFFGYIFSASLLIWALIWRYKLTWKDIGFTPIPQPSRILGLFIAGIGFLFIAKTVFLFLADPSKLHAPLKRLIEGPFSFDGAPYLEVIEGIVIAPIFEEILYRGAIQTIVFRHFKSKVKAVLLTSLFFTLSHSQFNLKNSPEEIGWSFALRISPASSLVYGSFFYLGGNNIALPIFLHSFTNIIGL